MKLGRSVGQKKTKEEWTHDCILNLTFSLQDQMVKDVYYQDYQKSKKATKTKYRW